MGGEGADDSTLVVLNDVLARRRGTSLGRQARDADELAVLVDRAGDVTREELEARVAPSAEWMRGNPIATLLASGRLVGVDLGDKDMPRYILVDAWPRYAAAFGARVESVRAGADESTRRADDAIPAPLRAVVLPDKAARREVLARYIALAGPTSVDDVVARYAFDPNWVERRLTEWERSGTLVRGVFGGDRSAIRWCTRRLLEQARRRELALARKAIAAVSIDDFARFLQRWQHLADDSRLSGSNAAATVMEQLQGLARPAAAWERDYLPARIVDYTPAAFDALAASGGVVWAAEPPAPRSPNVAIVGATPSTLGRIRFFERGTGRLWLGAASVDGSLSAQALEVRNALRAQGASFTSDLAAVTSLGPQRLRDALRELVAAGLVTNDTIGALRDVIRWKPVFPVKKSDEPDPTRWLPADFTPSPNRRIVQRRVNPRSIARWKRPDRPEAGGWGGRWSLLHSQGTLGAAPDDPHADAESIARAWLARYGVVSRDWWRREHPAVSWRDIYHELKRLEFRGDVR
ncbi:MAG: hypothetical protein ABIT38_22850, partial [Gemmatimonadaceae bacterium]